jgi:hypothetical protein
MLPIILKSRIGDFVTVLWDFCTFFLKKFKKYVTNPAGYGLISTFPAVLLLPVFHVKLILGIFANLW